MWTIRDFEFGFKFKEPWFNKPSEFKEWFPDRGCMQCSIAAVPEGNEMRLVCEHRNIDKQT